MEFIETLPFYYNLLSWYNQYMKNWLRLFLASEYVTFILLITYGLLLYIGIMIMSTSCGFDEPCTEENRYFYLTDSIFFTILYIYLIFNTIYAIVTTHKILKNKPIKLINKISLVAIVITQFFTIYVLLHYYYILI